jgi:rubrerythrin
MLENPTIQKAVEFAVATEDLGAQAYIKLAEKFSGQKEISEAFSILARDEKAHRAQFTALLKKLPPEADQAPGDEQQQYLRAMAMSEFFGGDAGLAAELEKIQSLEEALLRVFAFEKATLGFYLALREVLGQEDVLDAVIQAEKQHVLRLMQYICTEEKMKGLADDS